MVGFRRGSPPWVANSDLLSVSSRGGERALVPSCKGANPIMGTPPSSPRLIRVTSRRPHLVAPPRGEEGFATRILGGHKHSSITCVIFFF